LLFGTPKIGNQVQ